MGAAPPPVTLTVPAHGRPAARDLALRHEARLREVSAVDEQACAARRPCETQRRAVRAARAVRRDRVRRDVAHDQPRRHGVEEQLARGRDGAALVAQARRAGGTRRPGATRPASLRPSQRKRWRCRLLQRNVLGERADLVAVARHDRHRHLVGAAQPEREQRHVEAAVAVRREAAPERHLLDHRRGALQPGRDEEGRERRDDEPREDQDRHGSRSPELGHAYWRSAPTSTTTSNDPAISWLTESTGPVLLMPSRFATARAARA